MKNTYILTKEVKEYQTFQIEADSFEEAVEELTGNEESYLINSERDEDNDYQLEREIKPEYLEYVLRYLAMEEEVEEDEPVHSVYEAFEKAIGWRLNKEIVPTLPFTKLPSNEELRHFLAEFMRERLQTLSDIHEYQSKEFDDSIPYRTAGNGTYLAELKDIELYRQDEKYYHKTAVNSYNTYRFNTPDEAIIRLFSRLTGLSHYWTGMHIIKVKDKMPIKNFKYDWNTARFVEQPLVRFEYNGKDFELKPIS